MPLYTVPTTAVYRAADGDTRSFIAGTVIDMADAVEFGMAGATLVPAISGSVNQRLQGVAITATTDGLGDGTIPSGADYVAVTSANSANLVTLPNAAVGSEVALRNAATGYGLRSHDPATNAINGGTGATAKTAIAANTLVVCRRATAATWICSSTTTAGVVSVTTAAA